MPEMTPDDIATQMQALVSQYGNDRYALGRADQLGVDQPLLDAALAQHAADLATIEHLQDTQAANDNEPPSGYKVPNSADQIATMLPNTKVFLPVRSDGSKWVLSKKLLAADGFDILMARDAVMVKAFSAANAVGTCLVANAKYDLASPVKSFRMRGGTIEVADGMTGGIWGQYAEQDMRDITVENWSGGPLFGGGGPAGDHMYFENITSIPAPYDYSKDVQQPSGSGCAGWRPKCGGGKMVKSHIWAGDDSGQLVPAGATNDPMYNGPDLNFWYEDCILDSYTARPLGCGMQTGNTLPDGDTSAKMRINVSGGWLRCTGHAYGGSCVNIANHHGLGSIHDVQAIACEIWQDNKMGTRGQPGEVNLITYKGLTVPLGAVTNIKLEVKIHSQRVKPKGPKELLYIPNPALLGPGIDTSKVVLVP